MDCIDSIKKYIDKNLSEKRYKHSLGAALCAQKLAKIYNQDEEKAYLAGLVHDCAKNQDDFIDMMLSRNLLSHTYDFVKFKEIIKRIENNLEI